MKQNKKDSIVRDKKKMKKVKKGQREQGKNISNVIILR